ncbi:M4 family metallopeptidase [Kribbella sp. NPDC051936]|uniref:M4 family metallopeptidase n=1 Tax=Kribbella sp. NPDC051936 TaxID=3154946 RepID=UPI00341C54C2
MRSKTWRTSVALTSAAVLTLAALAAPAADAKPPTGATTAKALVFIPNPVQSSGDESLTDQKDSATAVPRGAYYEVTLTDLDGSGYLSGTWANVRSTTGTPAYTTNGTYFYDRHDDQFEQVMSYFWGTEAQKYLQSLGFGSTLPAVNAESQDYKVDQYGVDNSFSWDKHDTITLGKGGVDDAEDGEVIVHETGHAVHDAQVPGFGTSLEAGSIGEAFGDYFAVSVGYWVAKKSGVPIQADLACVMDWDSTSYTSTVPHCLRRLDAGKHYPESVVGEVHADGEIWSQALYDIRLALGPTVADRIIIDAQFDFDPDTSFAAAAAKTVATARSLYGPSQASAVQKAFADRGIV